jgi:hypothetical protein
MMTLSFAPDRIEMWPLAKLQPYARNAKAHGTMLPAQFSRRQSRILLIDHPDKLRFSETALGWRRLVYIRRTAPT